MALMVEYSKAFFHVRLNPVLIGGVAILCRHSSLSGDLRRCSIPPSALFVTRDMMSC